MKNEINCCDFNSKQEKHHEKWKRFIENLSDRKKDMKKDEKEKTKTFEDFFQVSTITKFYANRRDYEPPFLQGA